MLDREGAAGPADSRSSATRRALGRQLAALRDVGVTDFCAAVVATDRDAEERTLDFLATQVSKPAASARV